MSTMVLVRVSASVTLHRCYSATKPMAQVPYCIHALSVVRRLSSLTFHISSSLKPLNGIQQKLTGNQISTSSTKFVFFRTDHKTRWPPWPLIC